MPRQAFAKACRERINNRKVRALALRSRAHVTTYHKRLYQSRDIDSQPLERSSAIRTLEIVYKDVYYGD